VTRQDDAKRWARLEEILLPHELCRREEFLDLMVGVAAAMAGGTEPNPVTWVAARSIAADVWRLDRETSDAAAVRELVLGEASYSAGRHAGFRDADGRNTRKKMAVDGIRTAIEMNDTILAACRGEIRAPKGQVVRMTRR